MGEIGGRRTPGALERLPHAQVQLGAARRGQRVVERAADQLVREAVREPDRRQLLDHAGVHGLVERGQQLADVGARGGAQHLELELRARRRGQLQQLAGRGPQPREPPAHDLAHALRRAEVTRVGEGAPELADEERVAAGELADRAGDLRVRAHELGHLVAGQPREPQAHDVLGAAQVGERLAQRVRHVGVAERRQQQQPRAPAAARQVAQQAERRPVGPVHVLEHEQHGLVVTDAGEDVGDRGVEAVTDRVGVRVRRVAGPHREVGEQARELAAGRARARRPASPGRRPARGGRAPPRTPRRARARPRRTRRRAPARRERRPRPRTRARAGSCPSRPRRRRAPPAGPPPRPTAAARAACPARSSARRRGTRTAGRAVPGASRADDSQI